MSVLLFCWGTEPRQSEVLLFSAFNYAGQLGVLVVLREFLLQPMLTPLTAYKVNMRVSRHFQGRCIFPLIYEVLQCRYESFKISKFSEMENLATFDIAPILPTSGKKERHLCTCLCRVYDTEVCNIYLVYIFFLEVRKMEIPFFFDKKCSCSGFPASCGYNIMSRSDAGSGSA